MNDICLMSNSIESEGDGICKRNLASYPEVPRVRSSDLESLDLEGSGIRTR